MGIIRLLLALAVISGHTSSHPSLQFVGGIVAVQSFFMISGFYMAMILNTYNTKKDFYISRYLRLFPTYAVCVIISLVFVHGIDSYTEKINQLPLSAFLLLVFTNIGIFFQDIIMFLGVNNGSLSFVENYNNSTPPLHRLLLIPQGWSLGIELSFYVLAPFLLNRSSRFIIIIIFLSIFLRIILIGYGYKFDPWTFRFFPNELSIFLIGSLIFRVYSSNKTFFQNSLYSDIGLIFIILFLLVFPYISLDFHVKSIIFLISLMMFMGGIFSITKNSKIDNFIGMLSYPIYVGHMIVIHFLPTFNQIYPNGSFESTLICYLYAIFFSIILYFLIEKPADHFRHKLILKKNSPN